MMLISNKLSIYLSIGLCLCVGSAPGAAVAVAPNGLNALNAPNLQNPNSTTIEINLRLINDVVNGNRHLLLSQTGNGLDLTGVSDERFELQLENVLLGIIRGSKRWPYNWDLFNRLANSTDNELVKYAIYNVLWQEIESTQLKFNPFEMIDLYKIVKNLKLNSNSNSSVVLPSGSVKFVKLEDDIRSGIVTRSAQILEGGFYFRRHVNCSYESPLMDAVLGALNELSDDIYDETLNLLYEMVVVLESPLDMAINLRNFSSNTRQNVLAHFKFMSKMQDQGYTAATDVLKKNLFALKSKYDFGKLPVALIRKVNSYLPHSARNLYDARQVCIRNVTDPNMYLYECPQTYLICENAKDLTMAAFEIERMGELDFSFRSIFWARRYMKMEIKYEHLNKSKSLPEVTKNVYSKYIWGVWHVEFHGDFVALSDVNQQFYLCGGNSKFWDNNERHVYTRRAEDFEKYKHECLWLIEDCSKVKLI